MVHTDGSVGVALQLATVLDHWISRVGSAARADECFTRLLLLGRPWIIPNTHPQLVVASVLGRHIGSEGAEFP